MAWLLEGPGSGRVGAREWDRIVVAHEGNGARGNGVVETARPMETWNTWRWTYQRLTLAL